MFNIAANMRDSNVTGGAIAAYDAGQNVKAKRQNYEMNEIKKTSYLYEFGKQKKIDKAREAYFTSQDGSPEQQQATGMLAAHDPDFLTNMAEQQRKAQEAQDKESEGMRKAAKEIAPVMVEHATKMRSMPPESRTEYIMQNMPALLEMAPRKLRKSLEQGLNEALQDDGKLSDEELDSVMGAYGSLIDKPKYNMQTTADGSIVGVNPEDPTQTVNTGLQGKGPSYQYKTTQDGSIMGFDPQNPNAEPIDTGQNARDPKGGQLIMGPDGELIYASGSGIDAAMGKVSSTKATTSALQKDIADQKTLQSDLEEIEGLFDDSLLGYGASMSKFMSNQKDKLGVLEPGSDEAAFFKDKTRFDAALNQYFNTYRKLITGSAAAVQEMRDLKESIASVSDGPEGFKAKMSQMKEKGNRGLRIKMALMRDGFGTDNDNFGKKFDELYTSGFEDDPEAHFEFLSKQTKKDGTPAFTQAEIVTQMESLGYK